MTIEPLSKSDPAYALGFRWKYWDGDTLFLNKTKTGLMCHVERALKNRAAADLHPGRMTQWRDFKFQPKLGDDEKD